MNPHQARIIAQLAHKGQKYGDHDYFLHHVLGVVDLCEQNPHCTYGHVTLATLHDVVEDTDLSLEDLGCLGLDSGATRSLNHITKRKGEQYGVYLDRVMQDPMATFVKYYDLMFNRVSCLRGRNRGNPVVSQARALDLLSRYTRALQDIRDTKPYWFHE